MKKLFIYGIVCLFCSPGFLQAEKCSVQKFSEVMGKLGFKELNIRTDVPRKRIVSASKQVEDYDEKQVFYSRLRSYELSNFDYLLSKLPDIGKASQEERAKKMGVAMKRSIYVEILEYPNEEIAIKAYSLWSQKNNHYGMVGEYFVGSPDESFDVSEVVSFLSLCHLPLHKIFRSDAKISLPDGWKGYRKNEPEISDVEKALARSLD